MTFDEANHIDIVSILNRLGFSPVKQKNYDLWYHSPFRDEFTASFHVNTSKNVWYDFGEAKGGSAIDFIITYLESQSEDHTPVDALRYLRNMQFGCAAIPIHPRSIQAHINEPALLIKKTSGLQSENLFRYLQTRNIPLNVARRYLKEISVHNRATGKDFVALGFPHENEGYELRNLYFKGSLGAKDISFIRGSRPFPSEIHVFEGFMDFLSGLSFYHVNEFEGDVIVLNSTACIQKALPYMRNYGYQKLYSWTDNDASGAKVKDTLDSFCQSERTLEHKPMNELYAGFKDVNEWLVDGTAPNGYPVLTPGPKGLDA